MELKLEVIKNGISLGSSELVTNEEFTLRYGHVFRGAEGKSAYEQAVEGGYKGTKEEFVSNLNSLNKKTNNDGYYPSMSVGMADNLVGRGDVQDAHINFRPSGGANKNITDGAARIKAIKGNTVVWNQQLPITTDSWPHNLKLDGNTYTITPSRTDPIVVLYWQNGVVDVLPSNHKVFVSYELSISSDKEFVDEFYAGYLATPTQWMPRLTVSQVNSLKSTPMQISSILTLGSNKNLIVLGLYEAQYQQTKVPFDEEDTVYIKNPVVYDLTQMFGAGNEPTTIEEFHERKPMDIDEYAYNEGTIYSVKVDALKSVGDNAYNPEIHAARVMGGVPYHISLNNDETITPEEVLFHENLSDIYDGDGVMPNADGTYTFPSDGYVSATFLGGIGDVCVCLNHSYTKPFKGYEENVKDLSWIKDIEYNGSPLFPNGMRSAGNAYDEIYFDRTAKKWKAVKRIEGDGTNLYEITEPIVVTLDYPTAETNMDYLVWDFGTEEAIATVPSAPFRADISYEFNAVDDIRWAYKKIAELEAKLTQMTNTLNG